MPNFRIAKGLKIDLEPFGECIIHARLANGELQLFKVANYEFFSMPEERFVEGICDGTINVIYDESAKTGGKRQFAFSFVEFAPPSLRKETLRRFRYVKELINKKIESVTETTTLPAIGEVAKKTGDLNPPSFTAIYRWHKRFVESSEDIRSLIPYTSRRGNRRNKLSKDVFKATEVQEIIDEEINVYYLTTERPSVLDVHSRIAAKVDDNNKYRSAQEKLTCPCPTTIYDNIKKIDPYFIDLKRYGKRYADLTHKVVKGREKPKRPLEEVQMDHHFTDLMVVDDELGLPIGRATFSASIDAATSAMHGFYLSFYPPGYVSVMNCLLHGIQTKTYIKKFFPKVKNEWNVYGVPETILVDNGSEFYSRDFEDVCLQMGIIIQYHPPKQPNYKGLIERFFRTLNQRLLHSQPGTTFSSLFDRKDYDPKKNAVISLSMLIELIHIFIVDVYQQEINRGINDIPARKWNRLTAVYPPLLPSRGVDLNILLGSIEYRTVSKAGIAWNNLQYNSDELGLMRRKLKKGEKISFKYNPLDISMIYVADPGTDKYISVPALWQEYANNLTLWQHNIIQRYNRIELKKDYDFVSICRAKEVIRQIVRKAWIKNSKTGQRKRLAKLINYGGNYLHSFYESDENESKKDFSINTSSNLIAPDNQSELLAVNEIPSLDFSKIDCDGDEEENYINLTGWSGDFSLNTQKWLEDLDERGCANE